ncbi:MAG: hypothetical protein ACREBZ_06870 [Thermoplasmata archaeon]
MSFFGEEHASPEEHSPPIRRGTLGWIILAAILCGIGLLMIWWYITFFELIYLVGVLFVLAGSVIFFHTWSGPDSAE